MSDQCKVIYVAEVNIRGSFLLGHVFGCGGPGYQRHWIKEEISAKRLWIWREGCVPGGNGQSDGDLLKGFLDDPPLLLGRGFRNRRSQKLGITKRGRGNLTNAVSQLSLRIPIRVLMQSKPSCTTHVAPATIILWQSVPTSKDILVAMIVDGVSVVWWIFPNIFLTISVPHKHSL